MTTAQLITPTQASITPTEKDMPTRSAMPTHSTQALIPALKWRYATKQFDHTRKVPEAAVKELLEAVRLAPSSFGLQPWKVLVITDPQLRAKIREHAWGQPQVTDASHLIIFAARKEIHEEYIEHFIKTTAEARNATIESLEGFRGMLLNSVKNMTPEAMTSWNQRQAYIALGILMLGAAEKHIDSCPMEGFDAKEVDKVLGLTDYTATAFCPIGYRIASDKYAMLAKVRFPASEVIERR
jgi:nitroreductase